MNATTSKPETVLSLADFTVISRPDADPCDDYPFEVIDAEGESVEGFDEEEDAVAEATRLQEELDAERKDERLEALREQIGDLAAECDDEGKLRLLLAILKK